MSRQVGIKVQTEGARETARQFNEITRGFDGLTKAQQRQILSGSKVADGLNKAGNAARKGGKQFAFLKGAAQEALGSLGASSVIGTAQTLLNAYIERVKALREHLNKIRKEAGEAAAKKGDAWGNLLINDPDLAKDPKRAKALRESIVSRAAARGVGVEAAINSFRDVRSNTSGMSDADRMSVFDYALRLKESAPGVDLSSQTAAIAKIWQTMRKQDAKATVSQAANVLIESAKHTSMDSAALAAPFIKALALRQSGMSTSQIGSWLAKGSTYLQDTSGETTVTNIGAMVNRLAGFDEVRIGNRMHQFKANTSGSKMLELIEQISAADLSEGGLARTIKGIFGENQQIGMVVRGALGDLPGLRKALGSVSSSKASKESFADVMSKAVRSTDPTFASRKSARRAKALGIGRAASDTQNATIENATQQIESEVSALGLLYDKNSWVRNNPRWYWSRKDVVADSFNSGMTSKQIAAKRDELSTKFFREAMVDVDTTYPIVPHMVKGKTKAEIAHGMLSKWDLGSNLPINKSETAMLSALGLSAEEIASLNNVAQSGNASAFRTALSPLAYRHGFLGELKNRYEGEEFRSYVPSPDLERERTENLKAAINAMAEWLPEALTKAVREGMKDSSKPQTIRPGVD